MQGLQGLQLRVVRLGSVPLHIWRLADWWYVTVDDGDTAPALQTSIDIIIISIIMIIIIIITSHHPGQRYHKQGNHRRVHQNWRDPHIHNLDLSRRP